MLIVADAPFPIGDMLDVKNPILRPSVMPTYLRRAVVRFGTQQIPCVVGVNDDELHPIAEWDWESVAPKINDITVLKPLSGGLRLKDRFRHRGFPLLRVAAFLRGL